MAFTYLNTRFLTAPGTTAAHNTTAATFSVAIVRDNPGDPVTLSDNQGNTYQLAATEMHTNGERSRLFYVLNPNVSNSHTWTLSSATVAFMCVANFQSSSPVTPYGAATNTNTGNSITTGNISPLAVGDILVAVHSRAAGAGGTQSAAPAGYTNIQLGASLGMAYRTADDTNSQNANFVFTSGAGDRAGFIIGFYEGDKVFPAGIASGAVLGEPTIYGAGTVLPPAIPPVAAFGTPIVAKLGAIEVTGIPAIAAVGTPSLDIKEPVHPLTIVDGLVQQIQPAQVLVDRDGERYTTGTFVQDRIDDAVSTMVTATSIYGTDNRLIRSDGTGRGSQSSNATLSDGGTLTLRATVTGSAAPPQKALIVLDSAGNAVLEFSAGHLSQRNVFVGRNQGTNVTSANNLLGIGDNALRDVTSGGSNLAIGADAGRGVSTGTGNLLFGTRAGRDITTTGGNIAIGTDSGREITGSSNTCIGLFAGSTLTQNFNICMGRQAGFGLTTGSDNVFIGDFAGNVPTTGQTLGVSNCICIGADSISTASHQIHLGTTTHQNTFLYGDVHIEAGEHLMFATTTGSMIGSAANQLIGFWGTTPTAQPSGADQAALTNSTGGSADGTLAAVGDTSVGDESGTINDNFSDIARLLNEIRSALVTAGIIKGGA